MVIGHMVWPRLFLSDARGAASSDWLDDHGICAVVGCAPTLPVADSRPVFRVPLEDQELSPISDYFDGAASFIQMHLGSGDGGADAARMEAAGAGRWWARGPCVLVCCEAGRSRSAAIVLAYLMRCSAGPSTLEEAFLLVAAVRPIFPNVGFVQQLKRDCMQRGVRVASDALPGYWPALRVTGSVAAASGAGPDDANAAAVRSNARRMRTRFDRLPLIADVDSEAAELLRAGFPLGLTLGETIATAITDGWKELAANTLRSVLGRYISRWGEARGCASPRDCPFGSRHADVEPRALLCERLLDCAAPPAEGHWVELVGGVVKDLVQAQLVLPDFVEGTLLHNWPALGLGTVTCTAYARGATSSTQATVALH